MLCTDVPSDAVDWIIICESTQNLVYERNGAVVRELDRRIRDNRVVHRSPLVADRAKKVTRNMTGNVGHDHRDRYHPRNYLSGVGGGSRRLSGMAKVDHDAGRTRGA